MNAEQFPAHFLREMIDQLDTSIEELARKEKGLAASLGVYRVAELKEYWDHVLTPEEEWELKQTMDFRDRELVWIWSRLKRARTSRANAGQAYMRHLSPAARENNN
ncbi:MAG: hypothetical protein PHT19_11870 [Methylococcus sp.]|nr:hypothetical protein [Methylococcus sp.]